jgi:hypothetical protein
MNESDYLILLNLAAVSLGDYYDIHLSITALNVRIFFIFFRF